MKPKIFMSPLISRAKGPFMTHGYKGGWRIEKTRAGLRIAKRRVGCGPAGNSDTWRWFQDAWTLLDEAFKVLPKANKIEWGKCVRNTASNTRSCRDEFFSVNLHRMAVDLCGILMPPDRFNCTHEYVLKDPLAPPGTPGNKWRYWGTGLDKVGNPIPPDPPPIEPPPHPPYEPQEPEEPPPYLPHGSCIWSSLADAPQYPFPAPWINDADTTRYDNKWHIHETGVGINHPGHDHHWGSAYFDCYEEDKEWRSYCLWDSLEPNRAHPNTQHVYHVHGSHDLGLESGSSFIRLRYDWSADTFWVEFNPDGWMADTWDIETPEPFYTLIQLWEDQIRMQFVSELHQYEKFYYNPTWAPGRYSGIVHQTEDNGDCAVSVRYFQTCPSDTPEPPAWWDEDPPS